MIKAIIFDFDGLIIDTESVWFEAYKEILIEYEIHLTLEKFSEVIGTHDDVLYSYIEENSRLPIDRESIERKVSELVRSKLGNPVLRESVEDYLIAAKEAGLKIGLASSSSREWVEGYLKQLKIFDYFEVIKTSNDVLNIKPDAELYLKAIKALGIEATEAIAFEDSLNGLIAARKAGLHCVIVPNSVTANLVFEDYSLRLSSMAEKTLHDVIKHLSIKD